MQYVEIFLFNGRLEEIVGKFADNEKCIKKLSLNVSSIDEVNHVLDQLDKSGEEEFNFNGTGVRS